MRLPLPSFQTTRVSTRGVVWLTRDSNMLKLVPDGEQPRSRIVGPKLSYMDERIVAIDLVVSKLVRSAFSVLIFTPLNRQRFRKGSFKR